MSDSVREIKFRAWDKLDNKMYYNVGLSLIGVQVYKHPEFQPPEETLLDRGRDCFVTEQYIGLKDTTEWDDALERQQLGYTKETWAGVDIYDGDILRWEATTEGFKGEIFHNEVYWLVYRWRVKGTKNGRTFHADLSWNLCYNHKVKVVGNIHEGILNEK